VSAQSSLAAAAASTARSASAVLESWNSPMVSVVSAGFTTSKVSAVSEATHSPSM